MTVADRDRNILQALAVTVELIGAEMTTQGRVAMVEDLAQYPERAIIGALHRCRREVTRNKLTLQDIIDRLDDGRPGPEEAWSLYPKDEDASAIVTAEMQQAMSAAWSLVQDGDKVAGRMAFLEAYRRIVAENRANGVPVKWEPSFGRDPRGREAALLVALQHERLTVDRCLALLPNDNEQHAEFLRHAGVSHHLLLASPTPTQEKSRARLAAILGDLSAAEGPKKKHYQAECACHLIEQIPVPPICDEGRFIDENLVCAECTHAARCHLPVPVIV